MSVLAWHFVEATLRDGRPIPADGEWLEHIGRIKICSIGLHASRRPAHALEYAPGATLCLVECDGIEEEQDDKLVCRRRKIIARMDATEMLRYYARMQVVQALEFWPDPPDVVLDWLMTGDESQRAAAWVAAWDAAWDAASAAAWDAAWVAARAAASVAASAAASAAARDEFDALVYECFADFLPAHPEAK